MKTVQPLLAAAVAAVLVSGAGAQPMELVVSPPAAEVLLVDGRAEPAEFRLNLKNNGAAGIRVNVSRLAAISVQILESPAAGAVRTEPERPKRLRAKPAAEDFPLLPPGGETALATVSFPGRVDDGDHAFVLPGRYVIKLAYANRVGRFSQGRAVLEPVWKGRVESVPITLTVVAAREGAGQRIDPAFDGWYVAGTWRYRLSGLGRAGGDREIRGLLFHGSGRGAAVIGYRANDRVETPWGMMYWMGDAGRPPHAGRHGWMLEPRPDAPAGRLLAVPPP